MLPEASDLTTAGLLPIDALHVATALRAEAGAVLVHDRRLMDAAEAVGLVVEAPA